MQTRSACLISLIFVAALLAAPSAAKEGIRATVHTVVAAKAPAGTAVDLRWSLADKDSGEPVSANRVFVRLTGPTGETTEAFAKSGPDETGRYQAIATIPAGGISQIEIGIAGTRSFPDGRTERSDWLIDLANDPVQR